MTSTFLILRTKWNSNLNKSNHKYHLFILLWAMSARFINLYFIFGLHFLHVCLLKYILLYQEIWTLNPTPSLNLQMVVNLELMRVWGRENGGRVFLWVVCNVKVSVTNSFVMGKCGTGVLASVFCDARESMELP